MVCARRTLYTIRHRLGSIVSSFKFFICRLTMYLILSPALRANLWKMDTYLGPDDDGPSGLIQLDDILSHVIRADVTVKEEKCWATVAVKT